MAGLDYQSVFRHKPWVDGVDRVTAATDDGFNVRFQGIEAELDKVAGAPLAPKSVRSSHFDLVTGTLVLRTIASGASSDIAGPPIGVTPPAPALPLLSITSTTANALFSVTTVYRMDAGVPTTIHRVVNLSGGPIDIRATPYVLRG